ncbi:MAG: gamma-glutamylcyclotransferase family protein [Gaiellaceae bacterium]
MSEPRLYFAYGSNMASGVLAARGIQFRSIAAARLDDYRLTFRRRSIRTGTGVADIAPEKGSVVWGVVYELTGSDEAELDQKEGVPWAYSRRDVVVSLAGDAERDVFTYVVTTPEATEVPPSPDYVKSMLEGAREHGLPDDYVSTLEDLTKRFAATGDLSGGDRAAVRGNNPRSSRSKR